MRIIVISFVFSIIICFAGFFITGNAKPMPVNRGMYFWKTHFYLGENEMEFLKKHHIEKLYVKIMDIDWSAIYGAYPITTTSLEKDLNKCDSLVEIVPVVFITNESLLQTPASEIDTLGSKIILKAGQLCGEYYQNLKELQIDCDWTPKSKDRYFDLLQNIKHKLKGKQLSVTLRLHQLKYKSKTGIPPAHRAMLMLYNMGKLTNYNETNSILNITETKKYINGVDYELPLDFVLPVFNWGVKFSGERFEKLIYNVSNTTFDTCKAFTKMPNGYYKMINDYYTLNDDYYSYNDEVRLENITKQDLLELSRICRRKANTRNFTVSFFELNPYYLNTIDSVSYEEVYHSFH